MFHRVGRESGDFGPWFGLECDQMKVTRPDRKYKPNIF